MWQEFREFGLPILMLLVCIGALMVSAMVGVDYATCKGFSAATGYEVRYNFGCYAKVNDKWVPSRFVFGDAHELRQKKEDKN